LGSFLFRGDDVFKKVSVLSGGEKSRLALVKLLLDPPNLLLMDEPTTHLDMASIDALVGALAQFEGTLVFISHDVYFIKALGNKVTHVAAGKLTHYAGDYQYYLEKSKATGERAGLTSAGEARESFSATKTPNERKEQKRKEAQERQARSSEKKAQQRKVSELEKEIETREARQKILITELENPETYQKPERITEINRELSDINRRLKELNYEWEIEAEKLTQEN